MKFLPKTLAVVTALLSVDSSIQAQCISEWSPSYGAMDPGGIPVDSVVFDDGNGPELYFAGTFEWRKSPTAPSPDAVVRFDGKSLSAVGDVPLPGVATALAVYDSGSVSSLVALRRDQAWLYRDGSWTAVAGLFGLAPGRGGDPELRTAVSFDDGSGMALYVGGYFQRIDGQVGIGVARYDGTSWSSVGSGLSGGEVTDLHVHDFGTGPTLVAAGRFNNTGGAPLGRVARWTGSTWVNVGSSPPNGPVRALTSWNDGTQEYLVAGGNFGSADGENALRVAKFDGTSWSGFGSGFTLSGGGSDQGVFTLIAESAPSSRLVAGGRFDSASGVPVFNLAVWDGASWSDFADGLVAVNPGTVHEVRTLSKFDAGAGPELFVGGRFRAGESTGFNVARRRGLTWERLSAGAGIGVFDIEVNAGTTWDDGNGEQFYIGGSFTHAGENSCVGIARRNTEGLWDDLGGGFFGNFNDSPGIVLDLCSHDGPFSGSAEDRSGVYAVGSFLRHGSSDGPQVTGIARWDGTQWLAIHDPSNFSYYRGLEVFDDGSGLRLFACQWDSLHAWDGDQWEFYDAPPEFTVFRPNAMAVYDDGTGPAIYLGGLFTLSNGGRLYLVKWTPLLGFEAIPDPLGAPGPTHEAYDLEVFDDGNGPRLWLAGSSSGSPSIFSLGGLASFDGTQIVAHTSPLFLGRALAVLEDDGGLPTLYLGGLIFPSFYGLGAVTTLGSTEYMGFDRIVTALFTGPSLHGDPALYAGGSFRSAGLGTMPNLHSSGLAELTRTCTTGESFCRGTGEVAPGCTPCPCGNDAVAGLNTGCVNASGVGAELVASGSPSAARDGLRFEVRGMPQTTTGILFSGANRLPANPMNPCFSLASGIATLGDGLRCMGGDAKRHGARQSSPSGTIGETTNGWGPPNGPSGGLIAHAGFSAGQTRHFQVIHRDAVTSGCGTGINSTQGVTITFQP